MFRNLKFFIGGIIIFILMIVIANFIKKNIELNIDYTTCEPIGIYSKYQFENNKDKFLVNHISELSSSLIYFENDSIKSHCFSSTDEKDCIKSMYKRKQEISKCLFSFKAQLSEER